MVYSIMAVQQIRQQELALCSYLTLTPKFVEINLTESWHRNIRLDSMIDVESTQNCLADLLFWRLKWIWKVADNVRMCFR